MHTPEHIRELRGRVLGFIEERVYPAEHSLHRGGDAAKAAMAELQQAARDEGLWALGHPRELGGGGLPFLDYVHINEVQGRSEWGQVALGTYTLQDSLMLWRHAPGHLQDRFLGPMVAGGPGPSFAMTEPDVASSDPTRLRTSAVLEDGHWVITGHKWFTTNAANAGFTTVMCRTEPDAPDHSAFSMILVPAGTPGLELVRDTPVLGIDGGHWELRLDRVRVPADHLVGDRGRGFVIAQERLGPGRIFHSMRWLGQAQRAFDLMCTRLWEREVAGGRLAELQLMQQHVFDSLAEIQSARMLTLSAAAALDRGEQAREEIALIKVVGARMLHNVIDRAIQVHGAAGLTDDTPLGRMYREARSARIYDGPDEVHIAATARRVLRRYRDGGRHDLGA